MRKLFNHIIIRSALLLLVLSPATGLTSTQGTNGGLPPAINNNLPDDILFGELMRSLSNSFNEKKFKTIEELHDALQSDQAIVDTQLPKAGLEMKKVPGAIQDYYLTVLAKVFRGGENWGLDFADSDEIESGKDIFKVLLKGFPFDKNGLKHLRAFVMGYVVDEHLEEIQYDIIQAIKGKDPVQFNYSRYDYKNLKKAGETSFEYDSFKFDIKNNDFPENYGALRAKARIKNFPKLMQENLMGSREQVERVHALLKENFVNPNKKINISLLGTSGNGKTQFAKAMAIALFGDKDAMKKLTFSGKTGELSDYFRSSTGYIGSDQPTDFEKWFTARVEEDKGGIIVLDELLSFHGLDKEQISRKVQTINELYDLLDERVLKIGNQVYDMSKFHIVITGNALQEHFLGLDDDPDLDKEVSKILKKITKKEIINYFSQVGIDAPKLARFGEIFVNGPLNESETKEISHYLLRENLNEVDPHIKVKVDPKILDGIVSRLSTVELGMREVNIGLSQIVMSSLNGILFDLDEVTSIEAKLIKDKLHWYVDGEEVVLTADILNDESGLEERVWAMKKDVPATTKISTPQFDDLNFEDEIKVEKLELYITSVHEVKGHWMVNTMLMGENQSQTISNKPAHNYLGFVKNKEDDVVRASVLTRLLKRNIMLEAGHRAPILEGFMATGGGTTRTYAEGEMPSDDLNKIDRNLDAVMNNHLFKEYTNVGDEEVVKSFRAVLRDITKESTDFVIKYGNDIGFADELLEISMRDRFLKQEVLDEYTDRKLATMTMDRDELFFKSLVEGVQKTLKNYEKLPRLETLRRVEMLQNIVKKSMKEVIAIRKFEGASPELLSFIEKEGLEVLEVLTDFETKKQKGCVAKMSQFLYQVFR